MRVAISSRAPTAAELANVRFGVDQARRGWLEPADVLNTLRLEKFLRLART